jgi:hypothetical protein
MARFSKVSIELLPLQFITEENFNLKTTYVKLNEQLNEFAK